MIYTLRFNRYVPVAYTNSPAQQEKTAAHLAVYDGY